VRQFLTMFGEAKGGMIRSCKINTRQGITGTEGLAHVPKDVNTNAE
jgi:hypothetical protein